MNKDEVVSEKIPEGHRLAVKLAMFDYFQMPNGRLIWTVQSVTQSQIKPYINILATANEGGEKIEHVFSFSPSKVVKDASK